MAYCRMSENSDVYIIGNASRPGWTCFCGNVGTIKSRRDLLRHMITHLRKGEKVPAHATDRVIRELIQNRR